MLSRSLLAWGSCLLLVSSLSGLAHADDRECFRTNEKSQKLRREKKLTEAVKELRICSQPSCPNAVQKDCSQWLREVEAVLPTVSFGAKDQSGADLTDIRVAIDGEPLVEQLDGSAVAVNPGKHTFTFSHAGDPDSSQEVLVSEGDKARKIEVRFQGNALPPVADAGSSSSHSAGPFVLGGIGAAGLVGGIVLFAVGKGNFPDECAGELPTDAEGRRECRTKDQAVTDRATSSNTQSGIGVGLMVGGSLALAGGIGWFLVEAFSAPAAPAKAEETARRAAPKPRVLPTFGLGSVGLQGTF